MYAEQRLAGPVPAHQPPVGVHHHDQRRRGVQHRIQQPASPETGTVSRNAGATTYRFARARPIACHVRHTFGRMDLRLLDEQLAAAEEPRFRARQVWEWAARGAGSYDEMTNLPVELRERLAGEVPFSSLRRGATRRWPRTAPRRRSSRPTTAARSRPC